MSESAEEPALEEVTASLIVDDTDLGRGGLLPPHTVLKLLQTSRMKLSWLGPLYSRYKALQPPSDRRLVVKVQALSISHQDSFRRCAGCVLEATVRLGQVGRTSVELVYSIKMSVGGQPKEGETVATAVVVMVNVEGSPGNFAPRPLPEAVRARSQAEASSIPASSLRKSVVTSALRDMRKECRAEEALWLYPLTVRLSDEDINEHTNNRMYAAWVEDALDAGRAMGVVGKGFGGGAAVAQAAAAAPAPHSASPFLVLEYIKETRAGDKIEVRCRKSGKSPSAYELHFYLVARGGDAASSSLPSLMLRALASDRPARVVDARAQAGQEGERGGKGAPSPSSL